MAPKINCRLCKYFYITWEKKYPYGCRGYEFKTSQMPSVKVKSFSGIECLKYQPK
ncbi:MAG: uracil-DNA glycosylase [Ignavibacteriae bacterium HGW-Ignavibacteriae-2]|nr:MAG: uracil-DNA glycosylase [Ignavibacteriae bacterium HGW-Ignavibacteriae-2]